MRRTDALFGNLNKVHWDRRPWETGYRGPPLGKHRVTGKPHAIVHESHVNNLRERMEREWNTMRWLSRPYLDKQQIKPYQEINGNFLEEIKTKKEADKLRKMPGEPKILNEKGEPSKAYANYGNLLHKSRSVEDSFQHLINRTRWD